MDDGSSFVHWCKNYWLTLAAVVSSSYSSPVNRADVLVVVVVMFLMESCPSLLSSLSSVDEEDLFLFKKACHFHQRNGNHKIVNTLFKTYRTAVFAASFVVVTGPLWLPLYAVSSSCCSPTIRSRSPLSIADWTVDVDVIVTAVNVCG